MIIPANCDPKNIKVVAFDRDATLNHTAQNKNGYVYNWSFFKWINGAQDAIKLLNDKGIKVAVFTQQKSVMRAAHNALKDVEFNGKFGEEDIHAVHAQMNEDLAKTGAHIDQFEFCPHDPSMMEKMGLPRCDCAKPKTKMLEDIAKNFGVTPEQILVIGDGKRDLGCAQGFGSPFAFVKGDFNDFGHDHRLPDEEYAAFAAQGYPMFETAKQAVEGIFA